MKSTARTLFGIPGLIGVIVFVALSRFMDRDSTSVRAASQRAWLVVGLLLAGAYVIFQGRKGDSEHYQASLSPRAMTRRHRLLGLLAWFFIFVALVIGGRLVIPMI